MFYATSPEQKRQRLMRKLSGAILFSAFFKLSLFQILWTNILISPAFVPFYSMYQWGKLISALLRYSAILIDYCATHLG